MPDDLGTAPATLRTADGESLEARWSGSADARMVAVLTHPHPGYGGDMDNIVPATLARALPDHGIATVRFNFRGTGRSTGSHGDGEAEVEDVRAAVDAAAAVFPGRPVVGVGYSFGADVLLGLDDDRVQAVVAVAPPLAVLPEERMAAPRGAAPTLLLSAEHDQFRAFHAATALTGAWPATTHQPIAGTDHFLTGAMQRVTDAVVTFLTR